MVALVADSLGSQLREAFVRQGDVRAVAGAHCGAQIAGPLNDGTLEAVLAEQPDALVLALGTNSISENFAPAPGLVDQRLTEVEQVLAATDRVPCRVWVNVAAVDRGAREPDASMFIALAQRFNHHLARSAAKANGRVVIADWDALVASRPGLLMADGTHLTPAGEAARLQLIRDTLASACL